MKVLIVENEELAARKLKMLIDKYDNSIHILGVLDSVAETVKYFQSISELPDLVLMDIELSDGNSFAIFEQIEMQVPVIFTTTYDQYAVKAFKLNSVDYLLKPFGFEELEKSMKKFKEFYYTETNDKQQTVPPVDYKYLSGLLLHKDKNFKHRFLIYEGKNLVSIKSAEVASFYADGKNVFIVDSGGKVRLYYGTLDKIEETLAPGEFYRINRQTILHIKSIKGAKSLDNGSIEISTHQYIKSDLNVSIRRVEKFKAWLEEAE